MAKVGSPPGGKREGSEKQRNMKGRQVVCVALVKGSSDTQQGVLHTPGLSEQAEMVCIPTGHQTGWFMADPHCRLLRKLILVLHRFLQGCHQQGEHRDPTPAPQGHKARFGSILSQLEEMKTGLLASRRDRPGMWLNLWNPRYHPHQSAHSDSCINGSGLFFGFSFLLLLDHTQWRLGVTHGYALKNYSWKAQGSL